MKKSHHLPESQEREKELTQTEKRKLALLMLRLARDPGEYSDFMDEAEKRINQKLRQ